MAVFEFVSLTCLKPSEFDGDEVYIEFNGQKVFPGAGEPFRSFRAGHKIVNSGARVDRLTREVLLDGEETVDISGTPGADGLLRVPLGDVAMLIRVMEYDTITPDDVLGTILVPDRAENALQERRLEGDGGLYVFSFLVHPGAR